MSEFLSQENIDALLENNDVATAESKEKDSSDLAEGELLELFRDYAKELQIVVATLVNKDATAKCDTIFTVTEQMLSEQFGERETLFMKIPFSGAMLGHWYVLGSKEEFTSLAHLIMPSDDPAEYSEDDRDTLVELHYQVAERFATYITNKWASKTVSIDAVSVVDDREIRTLSGSRAVSLSLTVDGQEPFMMFVSPDESFMQSMESVISSAKNKEENESGMSEAILSPDEVSSLARATSDLHTIYDKNSSVSSSSHSHENNVDIILDIELDVVIELGKTNISIKKILELAPGSLVELDCFAGEPVSLLVNNKVVAKGEVVVVDESFGIRILSLVSSEERIKSLR